MSTASDVRAEAVPFVPEQGQAAMSTLAIAMVLLLALVETLASYISRVYAEFGKILARENRTIWTRGKS